jgi:hypothetical protein
VESDGRSSPPPPEFATEKSLVYSDYLDEYAESVRARATRTPIITQDDVRYGADGEVLPGFPNRDLSAAEREDLAWGPSHSLDMREGGVRPSQYFEQALMLYYNPSRPENSPPSVVFGNETGLPTQHPINVKVSDQHFGDLFSSFHASGRRRSELADMIPFDAMSNGLPYPERAHVGATWTPRAHIRDYPTAGVLNYDTRIGYIVDKSGGVTTATSTYLAEKLSAWTISTPFNGQTSMPTWSI